MEIEEYKKAKRKAELRITNFIKMELSDFWLKTGLAPNNIEVSMSDVTTVSSLNKEFIVNGVKLTVDL